MIKIEHTVLPSNEQLEAIIYGARNPMNSWDRMDSYYVIDNLVLGENDKSLLTRLAKAGTDHRKFMRMMNVYIDVTAPLYWWKEADTHKVGTVTNGCSTMHRIHSKEFTLEDFSCEHLRSDGLLCDSMSALKNTIDTLNFWRKRFNESDESRQGYFEQNGYHEVPSKKDCWWQIIQLLPSSYNQKRTIMLNYEVLRNMYHARKNHKLDEWHTFCGWIETLPYFEELINSK